MIEVPQFGDAPGIYGGVPGIYNIKAGYWSMPPQGAGSLCWLPFLYPSTAVKLT